MRRQNLLVLAFPLLAFAACADHSHDGPPSGGVLQTILFETRSEILIGEQGGADVATGDFDGDGRPDLAVACLADKVQILLGGGNGTFSLAQSIAVPGRPSAIAVADLDRDLDLDLAVLQATTGTVRVLVNDGHATFSTKTDLTVGPEAFAVTCGDCNHDGIMDVVATQLGAARVMMFHGTTTGAFANAVPLGLPPGAGAAGVAIGDLDGDGINDMAIADQKANRLLVLYGQASGGYGQAGQLPAGQYPVAVAIGDVNGDGIGDLVGSNLSGQSLTLSLSQGTIGRTERTLRVDGAPGAVAVADVNGDRLNDIVTCVFGRCGVSIFESLSNGQSGEEVQLGASGFPAHCATGDFNLDRRPDLVAVGGGDRLSLWLGASLGLSGSVNYATGLDAPEFVAAGDFDGDGQAEVAVGGRASTVVSLMRRESLATAGRNQLRQVAVIDVGRPVYNLAAGDFNRDDRTDLVISCAGGVKLLVNTSAGGVPGYRLLPSADPDQFVLRGTSPFEVGVADLDLDGRSDLVAADVDAGALLVLHAIDDQFHFADAPISVRLAGKPAGLALGDFVPDGLVDIAVSRNAANVVTIVQNLDGQRFAIDSEIPVGAGPNYLRTADFNGDGRKDLVVSNAGIDAITVLFAQGRGFRAVQFPAGERPTALLARDLNRDGWPDILVASLVGADFRVLLGDGRGGFPTVLPFPGTYRATSAAMADLDGDSLLDLLVASVDTSRVSFYRNLSR